MYDGAIDPSADPLENLARINALRAAGGTARADGQIDGSAVRRSRERRHTVGSPDRHSSGEMRENMMVRGGGSDREWLDGAAPVNGNAAPLATNGQSTEPESDITSSDEERFEGGGAR